MNGKSSLSALDDYLREHDETTNNSSLSYIVKSRTKTNRPTPFHLKNNFIQTENTLNNYYQYIESHVDESSFSPPPPPLPPPPPRLSLSPVPTPGMDMVASNNTTSVSRSLDAFMESLRNMEKVRSLELKKLSQFLAVDIDVDEQMDVENLRLSIAITSSSKDGGLEGADDDGVMEDYLLHEQSADIKKKPPFNFPNNESHPTAHQSPPLRQLGSSSSSSSSSYPLSNSTTHINCIENQPGDHEEDLSLSSTNVNALSHTPHAHSHGYDYDEMSMSIMVDTEQEMLGSGRLERQARLKNIAAALDAINLTLHKENQRQTISSSTSTSTSPSSPTSLDSLLGLDPKEWTASMCYASMKDEHETDSDSDNERDININTSIDCEEKYKGEGEGKYKGEGDGKWEDHKEDALFGDDSIFIEKNYLASSSSFSSGSFVRAQPRLPPRPTPPPFNLHMHMHNQSK